MPCYKPGRGRQAPSGALTYYGHLQIAAGKLPPLPPNYKDFALPCGKCHGCRLERSRQWAVRLVHEAQQHTLTSFITLTYRDSALEKARNIAKPGCAPAALGLPHRLERKTRTLNDTHVEKIGGASLVRQHLQSFTKRLNEDVRRRAGKGVKYYACGEYGDETDRPHYHIAVYGEDFSDDRRFWKHAKTGHPLWRSSRLTRLWPHGDADIGELTFESAAYIARYIMKKITGKKADEHYKRWDEEGNEYWIEPEFNVMSRRPGLARQWFLDNQADVYPHDHVISRGHPAKPPRYYDKLLEQIDPYLLAMIKANRETEANKNLADQTPARLEARETVAIAAATQLKRSLE